MPYVHVLPPTAMIWPRHVLWLLVIAMDRDSASLEETPRQRLKRDLLQFYYPHTFPWSMKQGAGPIVIYLHLHVRMVHGLEMREETLTLSGWLETEWIDTHLTWDPQDYDNITEIQMFANNIWLPDFTMDLSDQRTAFVNDTLPELSVRFDGLVRWDVIFIQEISCNVDIRKYPFDTQMCMIRFKSSVYTNESQILRSKSNAVNLDQIVPNGELDIYKTASRWETVPSHIEGHFRVSHTFVLYMKRQVFSYVLTIIIPVVLLSSLNVIVFIVPCDTKERMSMAVSALLALTLYLAIITENIPKISEHASILIIYLTLLLVLSLASLMCAGAALNINLHDARGSEVPVFLRKIYSRLCLTPEDAMADDELPLVTLKELLDQYRISKEPSFPEYAAQDDRRLSATYSTRSRASISGRRQSTALVPKDLGRTVSERPQLQSRRLSAVQAGLRARSHSLAVERRMTQELDMQNRYLRLRKPSRPEASSERTTLDSSVDSVDVHNKKKPVFVCSDSESSFTSTSQFSSRSTSETRNKSSFPRFALGPLSRQTGLRLGPWPSFAPRLIRGPQLSSPGVNNGSSDYLSELKKILAAHLKEKEEEEITWRNVSDALDMVMFWVFLVLTVSLNVIIIILFYA